MFEIPKPIRDAIAIVSVVGFFTGFYLSIDHFNEKMNRIMEKQSRIIDTIVKVDFDSKARDELIKKQDDEWLIQDNVWNTKLMDSLDELRRNLENARKDAINQRKEIQRSIDLLKFKH